MTSANASLLSQTYLDELESHGEGYNWVQHILIKDMMHVEDVLCSECDGTTFMKNDEILNDVVLI